MEKERMRMARRGLAITIADMVEGTQDFSVTQVRVADTEMQKLGAYTLIFAVAIHEAWRQIHLEGWRWVRFRHFDFRHSGRANGERCPSQSESVVFTLRDR